MQQRQLRLGDILDDYCPRERRLTNHAVVAMVGAEVRLTRCTTCDAEHEYKHARVPRQRPKPEAPALSGPGAVVAQKRVPATVGAEEEQPPAPPPPDAPLETPAQEPLAASAVPDERDHREAEAGEDDFDNTADSGPVHRRLIRATFPRTEGQPPPARPPSEFTIRQPTGRGQRFRPRPQRMDQPFHGQRSNGGGGNTFRGGQRSNAGHGSPTQRPSNRGGQGRRRPK